MARWSIQTITLRCGSPDVLTETGSPSGASTTSEQVASKPMPLTASAEIAASASAVRTAVTQALQILSEDCSTMSPASCQVLIGCLAIPSSFPVSSNTPALVLEVPTSTPI